METTASRRCGDLIEMAVDTVETLSYKLQRMHLLEGWITLSRSPALGALGIGLRHDAPPYVQTVQCDAARLLTMTSGGAEKLQVVDLSSRQSTTFAGPNRFNPIRAEILSPRADRGTPHRAPSAMGTRSSRLHLEATGFFYAPSGGNCTDLSRPEALRARKRRKGRPAAQGPPSQPPAPSPRRATRIRSDSRTW